MSRSARKHVLFISDSRGRGFDSYVESQNASDEYRYRYIIESGLTLEKIKEKIHQQHRYRKFDYTVVLGGICSLTEKTKQKRKAILSYPKNNSPDKKERVIKIINDLKEKLAGQINLCTIIPACLTKYYQVQNRTKETPDFTDEQSALLDDIEEINNTIKRLNSITNTPNIDYARRCYKHSLKRRRTGDKNIKTRVKEFENTKLWDGVHLDKVYQSKLFEIIFDTIKRQLNPTEFQEQQDPLEGTSNQDIPGFIVVDEIEGDGDQEDVDTNTDEDTIEKQIPSHDTSQESIEWGDFKRRRNPIKKSRPN